MNKNEESFYIRVRMRKEWTPLFNTVPAQYRRLKDDGEPIKYFDLG